MTKVVYVLIWKCCCLCIEVHVGHEPSQTPSHFLQVSVTVVVNSNSYFFQIIASCVLSGLYISSISSPNFFELKWF